MVMPGTVWTVYCGLGGSDGKRPIPLGSDTANEQWALCDGTNGTPDLRGRVIIGAGGAFALGDRGGVESHTLNSPPANTAEATLTASQVGFHEHFTVVPLNVGNGPLPSPTNSIAQKGEKNNYNQYNLRCSPNTPTACRTSGNTGGGSSPHHHAIPPVSFGTLSNLPPYLALHPVMRLP